MQELSCGKGGETSVMIYANFTGRVAKKAKVIDGVNGQFLCTAIRLMGYRSTG
jgi:hypothetical protein